MSICSRLELQICRSAGTFMIRDGSYRQDVSQSTGTSKVDEASASYLPRGCSIGSQRETPNLGIATFPPFVSLLAAPWIGSTARCVEQGLGGSHASPSEHHELPISMT